jgi:hypothetical protein
MLWGTTTAPTVTPDTLISNESAIEVTFGLTGDEISNEPLQIVPTDPMNKREEAVEVASDITRRRSDLAKPLSSRRFFLDIGIGSRHRESRFASRYFVVAASRISICTIDL